ncbi:MAG: tetraacyldisaccharide 4'-kinase, partial [Longimicrobiales bacterium]
PAALGRAGLLVCIRKTPVEEESLRVAALLRRLADRPVLRAHLRASGWQQGGTAVAAPPDPGVLVAGLADPALFAANARAAGAAFGTELLFPDHHAYGPADVRRIRAAAAGRAVITSAKDWVKLRETLDPAQTWVLTQTLVIEEGGSLLDAALGRVLQ